MYDVILGHTNKNGYYNLWDEIKRLNLKERINEIMTIPELHIEYLRIIERYAKLKYADDKQRSVTITYYNEVPVEYFDCQSCFCGGMIDTAFHMPDDIRSKLSI